MERGLSEQEALQKLHTVGRNEIIFEKPFSGIKIFLSQFPSRINAVLFLAGIFSLFVHDPIDALFIFAILLINGIIGFLQEYNAEKSLEKLRTFVTPVARVFRDGMEIAIPTTMLVPGDIVVLSEGDRIPADGIITTTHHIEIDESILTGESFPDIKSSHDEVFSGTLVTKGTAHFQVKTTGMETRFGKIATTLASLHPDKTPLQIKLAQLSNFLTLIVIVITILIFLTGFLRGQPLIPIILLAVSAGIAAIPEGLPAVVTVALALATSRMAAKKAIVRKLPVVETLGAVQIVLIDKTGTLTQNTMRVKKHWVATEENFSDLLRACILGNTAAFIKKADAKPGIIGDKTDAALLLFAKDHIDIQATKKEGVILEEYVFDPETKTITTVIEKNGERLVFVRGAPEILLEKSLLSEEQKKVYLNHIDSYAKEGLRVIGFATRKDTHPGKIKREEAEKDLEFLGFVGIYDPPRPEVAGAVAEAKKAGIHAILVTGDNELTALTVAREVGLIEQDDDVITGEELEELTDEELEGVILKTRVFARTTPEHKLRLVTTLKHMGYVVGVTGDGVNDALALKKSDVGIAMGETGTDVAKEASDIILTDDNFATLVTAIEEGRTVYKNILVSITYLLAGNLSEITFIFLSAVAGVPVPFHPTQILWINIITDGLPALALAADVKDDDVLSEEPRNPKDPFLNKRRIILILVLGLTIGVSLLITYWLLLRSSKLVDARMFVFNMLLIIHLIMVFAIRGKPFFRMNTFLLFSVIVSVFAQFAAVTLPIFLQVFELR